MTLTELVALLRSTGYPVAFSHFKVDENNPPPNPPFIVYTTPNNSDFIADNKNYYKITDVDIELYTDKKDLEAEQAIERLLDANDLPYNSYQVFIEKENLHQKIYEVRLI